MPIHSIKAIANAMYFFLHRKRTIKKVKIVTIKIPNWTQEENACFSISASDTKSRAIKAMGMYS